MAHETTHLEHSAGAALEPTRLRHVASSENPSRRLYYVIFGLLLALLALTVAIAQIHLGRFNAAAALSIACFKAVLVVTYFMHAGYRGALIRLVATGAMVWLTILIALVLCDYLTRG